jgi:hypothetical protein
MNEAPPTPTPAKGWYLYGIVHDPGSEVLDTGISGADAPQLLRHGDLAAVAAPVPLAEYEPEVLRLRLRDPVWVEAAVRRHHEVVTRIHSARIILPAKFGSVYASVDDVLLALEREHEELRARLAALTDCDEWSVHVYATSRQAVDRMTARDTALARLEQDMATAPPGRAYFLRRKLDEARARATERGLTELAEAAHERLSAQAVASEVAVSERRGAATADDEIEILRAAYLVQRPRLPAFVAELEDLARAVREEWTGPWPPYSFAAPRLELA